MKRILIVDDDHPTQQLLTALMKRGGYTSVVASNGAEAIDILGRDDFSVVILDLMMPTVDGRSVIEFLEQKKMTTPVIVCTAAGPRKTESIQNDIVKAIIRKPFDIEHLAKIVASLTKP